MIEGLNQGVAGFYMWSIHEMYYNSETLMRRALWRFKTSTSAEAGNLAEQWRPRPVFYLWDALCRLTDSGATVRECTSSHPAHLTAALVGDTLFWANRAKTAVTVRFEGFDARTVHIVTADNLRSDTDYGETQALLRPEFQAPPRSFGWLRARR